MEPNIDLTDTEQEPNRAVETRSCALQVIHPIPPYVSIAKFCQVMEGYSEKAIRQKIANGVWMQGREYVKAPDRHIFIKMEAFYKWLDPTYRKG